MRPHNNFIVLLFICVSFECVSKTGFGGLYALNVNFLQVSLIRFNCFVVKLLKLLSLQCWNYITHRNVIIITRLTFSLFLHVIWTFSKKIEIFFNF